MSEEGRERLRRMLTDAGLAEGRDGQAETSATIRPAVELAADERAENERCALCLGPLNPRRKVKVAEHQYAHRICASLPQEGEWVLRHWLATSLEVRRRRIQQHYGRDPLSGQVTATDIEWLRWPLDADGLPIRMEVERTRQARVLTVGVPRCYWSEARARGWLPG